MLVGHPSRTLRTSKCLFLIFAQTRRSCFCVQGGKAIVTGIQEVLGLKDWQTQCSRDVLRNFGNMVSRYSASPFHLQHMLIRLVQSSATFLFVLDQIKNGKPTEATTPWVVGMGYVPCHPLPFYVSFLTRTSRAALVLGWRSKVSSCDIPKQTRARPAPSTYDAFLYQLEEGRAAKDMLRALCNV